MIAIEDNNSGDSETEEYQPAENNAPDDNGPELQISMHALSDTLSNAKTFPLFVHIGNIKVLALIDSGSTTTFLDPSLMTRAHLPVITNHALVKVTVANENILWTQAVCANVSYYIQGHEFSALSLAEGLRSAGIINCVNGWM
jgi:hypothetical protein